MAKRDRILIIVIGVLIVTILVILFYKTEKEFDIQDRCGPIVNMISHSLPNDAACKTRCKQQCETGEMSYSKHIFTEAEVGCHSCKCYCSQSLIK